MHLQAFFLPLLFKWVKSENFLEYHIGNFFDRPKKRKKKENDEKYLDRLTPSQAVRIAKYNFQKWYYNNASYHVVPPDLSKWEEESRKPLEQLIELLFLCEEQWHGLYRKALARKVEELRKPKKHIKLGRVNFFFIYLGAIVCFVVAAYLLMLATMGFNHLLLALHLPIIKELPIFGSKLPIPPPPLK